MYLYNLALLKTDYKVQFSMNKFSQSLARKMLPYIVKIREIKQTIKHKILKP